jgi:hypothetical protein
MGPRDMQLLVAGGAAAIAAFFVVACVCLFLARR